MEEEKRRREKEEEIQVWKLILVNFKVWNSCLELSYLLVWNLCMDLLVRKLSELFLYLCLG